MILNFQESTQHYLFRRRGEIGGCAHGAESLRSVSTDWTRSYYQISFNKSLLDLLLHSSIPSQPVGDPVDYFNERQETEAHAQPHEATHL